MAKTPKATKIMLIRHAEKPLGTLAGVDLNGSPDKSSLIIQGWQRAGALACLFAPTHGPLQDHRLVRPEYLYSATPRENNSNTPGDDGDSNRPYQTILPLSLKLGMTINTSYTKTEIEALVGEVEQCDGVVLIAWEHGEIPKIANIILGDKTAPQTWPANRFDVVWVFDWDSQREKYRFHQVPQLLLAGDLPTKID